MATEQTPQGHRDNSRLGTCNRCGGKPRDGYRTCEECAVENRRTSLKHREECKTKGHCIRCPNECVDGSCHCQKHKDYYGDLQENLRIKRLATNLCMRCGKNPPNVGAQQCKECSAQKRKEAISTKLQVMETYGNHCVCCGEKKIDFLAIDHINDDGNQEKRSNRGGIDFYREIIKNRFPSNLQILCHNCNWSKHVNKGKCIHQTKRETKE